jgi:hypothetical protein
MIMPKKRLISGIPESKYLCFGAVGTTQPAAPCDGNADPGEYFEQCVFADAVSVNDVQHFALLNKKVDVVQRLEQGALFNRLTGKPPPLIKCSGFHALQLAKLVFFGDVVDFDDGHSG